MDLSSHWPLYLTLTGLTVALFHYSLEKLLKRTPLFSAAPFMVRGVFIAFRYAGPLLFSFYLVFFEQRTEAAVKFLCYQGGVLFCAAAIDVLQYGYVQSQKKVQYIKGMEQRLSVIKEHLRLLDKHTKA